MKLHYLLISLCYFFVVSEAEPRYKGSQPTRVKKNPEFEYKSRDKLKDTYDRPYKQKNTTYKPKDAYNRPQKTYRPKNTIQNYKPKYTNYKPGSYGGGYDSDVVTLDDGTRVVIKAFGPNANANAEGTSQGNRIVGTTIGSDGRSRTIVYGDEQGSLYVNSDSIVAESDGGVNTRYNKLDGSGFVRMRGDGDTGEVHIYHSDGETQIGTSDYDAQTYRIGRGDVYLTNTLYTSEGPMNVDYRQKKGNLKTSGISNLSTSGESKYLFNVGGNFDTGKIFTGKDSGTDIRIKAQDIVTNDKFIDSRGNVKAKVNAKNMYVDGRLANVLSSASQADLHFNVKDKLVSDGVKVQAEGSKVFIRANDIITDGYDLISTTGSDGPKKIDATVFANSLDVGEDVFQIGGEKNELNAKLRVKGDLRATDIIDSNGDATAGHRIYAKTYVGGHADINSDILDVDSGDTTVKMTSIFGKNVELSNLLDIDDENTNVDFKGRFRGDIHASSNVIELDEKGAKLRSDLFVKGKIFSDADDLITILDHEPSTDKTKAYVKVRADSIDVNKIVDFGDSKGAYLNADVIARSGIVADKVFELSSSDTRDNKLYAKIGSKYIEIRDELGRTDNAENNELNINFLKAVPNDDTILEVGNPMGNKYNLRNQKKNLRANIERPYERP